MWYDAATITGRTDGQALNAVWADQSGNGNDAANTAPPTYRTTSGPNTLPWVEFPSAGDRPYMSLPNVLSGVLTAGTLFVVVKITSLATAATFGRYR